MTLVSKVDSLMKKIITFGHNASGDRSRLCVTGSGQFFNDTDRGCDNATFARTANPVNDGEPHNLLTTDLRQDFDAMSCDLNLGF